MFLFSGFLMFAIGSNVGFLRGSARQAGGLAGTTAALSTPGDANASPKLEATAAGRSDPSRADIERWFEGRIAHVRENPKLTFCTMKTAGEKHSWALIPLSLPFLWLLYPGVADRADQ